MHIKWIGNPFGRCVSAHQWRTPVYPLTNRLSVPVCYTKKISQKATFSKLFQRKREGDLGKQLKQMKAPAHGREGGALNWWVLLPTFSWHGYEPDWPPPICVGAFLVMMLLAIFGESRPPQTAKMKFFRHCLGSLQCSPLRAGIGCSRVHAHTASHVRRLIRAKPSRAGTSGRDPWRHYQVLSCRGTS